jgi:Meiotically up-regulated gene 113
MQLEEYGINLDGELISIEQTRRGKTDLSCPYCNCGLTAKKGEVKAHHFAHTEATCKAISGGRDTELPLFDRFLLHLSPKEFDALKQLNRGAKIDKEIAKKLKQAGFITHEVISVPRVGCRNVAKITTLGKIICGTASMAAFARSQSELILEKLVRLERRLEIAYEQNSVDWQDLFIDLQIYRDRIRRLLVQTLYFLQIVVDGDRCYKIGVTSRTVEERISEIERQLKTHFQSVSIEVYTSWAYYGYLERYFLYKYHGYQYQIGNLTEYFKLKAELAELICQKLREIEPKELLPVESELIDSIPSIIEHQIVIKERAKHSTV